MSTEIKRKITLTQEDGVWVAKDEDEGVASQGSTKEEALDNLEEAVALHKGEIGREPTEEELREIGIDPEDNDNDNEAGGELPDFLK
ncbi:type II toxin-antitoxin system HicB family antitoxin [Halorutilales archaeon Cl-col2-1]